MGLFDIFSGKNKEEEWADNQAELQNWNDIVYTRKALDMDDPVQRREYINSWLQQMQEAARYGLRLSGVRIDRPRYFSDITGKEMTARWSWSQPHSTSGGNTAL